MRQIVDDVLAAEAEARAKLEETKSRLARVRADADAEAERVLAEARDAAARLLHERLDEARALAAGLALQAERDDEAAGDALLARVRPLLPALAVRVAELVMAPRVPDARASGS